MFTVVFSEYANNRFEYFRQSRLIYYVYKYSDSWIQDVDLIVNWFLSDLDSFIINLADTIKYKLSSWFLGNIVAVHSTYEVRKAVFFV